MYSVFSSGSGLEIEEAENSELMLRNGTKYLCQECQEMKPENKLVLNHTGP